MSGGIFIRKIADRARAAVMFGLMLKLLRFPLEVIKIGLESSRETVQVELRSRLRWSGNV